MKVYPGKLQVQQSFCLIEVNDETTISNLIQSALISFGLYGFRAEDYRCSQILLDRGGSRFTPYLQALTYNFQKTRNNFKACKRN